MSRPPRPSFRVLLSCCRSSPSCVGACSSAGSSPSVALASPTAGPDRRADRHPAPTASPDAVPAFPVTLTDDEGTAVKLAAEPQKIVSLTPATTETLFAIGAGDRVVATDDGSDYPAEAAPLPDVATFGSVDVEKIVALDADLVVAGGTRLHPGRRDHQAPLARRPGPGHLRTVDRRRLQGHRAHRRRDRAVGRGRRHHGRDAARTSMPSRRRRRPRRPPGPKPRVFYDVGYPHDTGQIYGAGRRARSSTRWSPSSAVDVITTDPTTYEIPLEQLIERDPQVIILGVNAFYKPTAAEIAKRDRLERPDRGQERRHPSRRRHRDHPARVRACRPGCATWRSRCTPTSRCRRRRDQRADVRVARSRRTSGRSASPAVSAAVPV